MIHRRILIVNPFGIGDMLFTTPLIRALRQAFPGAFLGYLCNRRTEPVLRNNPHVNELFVYERDEIVHLWRHSKWAGARQFLGLLRRLRRARFDLVVDVSLGERYSTMLQWLGVRQRVGFNYRRRGRSLTASLTIDGYHDEHVVDYYRRLMRFLGIVLQEPHLEVSIAAADVCWAKAWLQSHGCDGAPLLIGMIPAGGVSWGIDAPFRRWSLEGFAKVADALTNRYAARILLFGEAADAPTCQAVASRMTHPALDVSGQTSLEQFVGLLSQLDLVICNDGGPLHLAVSQGVKTVSIFGPVDPKVYGPYPHDRATHWVIRQEELPCRPCYHRFRLPPCPYERACLTTISAAEVEQACVQLLDGAAAAPGSRAALAIQES
jgi:ADP-heptose:LPS heptosyltransferase